jgi:iron uptake system component EfeO
MKNSGTKVNELYVLSASGDTLGEKEDIGPGTTGSLTVELKQGSYQLRCKPGQSGDGIVSPITVTAG